RVHVRVLEDGGQKERPHAGLCLHAGRRRRQLRSRRHAGGESRQAGDDAPSPLLQLLRFRLVLQRNQPLRSSSTARCSSGVAAATTLPPSRGLWPCQSVMTAPAPSRIGISGTMSNGCSCDSTTTSTKPAATIA